MKGLLPIMRDFFIVLIENREWLFSGIGVTITTVITTTIITAIIRIFKIKKNNKEQTVFNINLLKDDNTEKQYTKLDFTESTKSKVDLVVERFIQIYEAHGIQQNQIAFFVDKKFNLQLRDFKDSESILQILDENLIKWTCEKFGIKKDWLDGTSNKIYERKDYYKQVEHFIDDICKFVKEGIEIELFAFKEGEIDREDDNQDVILLLRYPIDKINSKTIYKYVPIANYWKWGYWRSRYQLKSIFYICERLHIFIKGYDLKERRKIADGIIFPEELIESVPITLTWYPEDYIDLISQSVQAKETDETEKVREYIMTEKYLQQLNELLKSTIHI